MGGRDQLFAHPDDLVRRPHVVHLRALDFLGLKQPIDSIESHAPVIPDDAPASVGIGQAGDDARLAAFHDFRCVCIEHTVVVRFPVLGKRFVHLRIGGETRRLQTRFDHAQPTKGKDRALERRISLQTDDHLIVSIDVTSLVCKQCRGVFRVDREDTFLSLLLKIRLKLSPNRLRAL